MTGGLHLEEEGKRGLYLGYNLRFEAKHAVLKFEFRFPCLAILNNSHVIKRYPANYVFLKK